MPDPIELVKLLLRHSFESAAFEMICALIFEVAQTLSQRQANYWAAPPSTRPGRPNHLHRQGIESAGRNRSRHNSLTRECLYRISRPPARRMADQNSARAEENLAKSPNEIQRSVPF